MGIQSESSRKTNRRGEIKRVPLSFAVESIELLGKVPVLGLEPMYDFTSENISRLCELLDAPFLSFDGIEKYPTLEEKAAVIFCATIRGHKFGNGNKRTAVMLLLAILYVNGKWVSFSWSELYELAMEIAGSGRVDFDSQIEDVAKILAKKIITLAGT